MSEVTITNCAESIFLNMDNNAQKVTFLEALTNVATAKANLYTAKQMITDKQSKVYKLIIAALSLM